MSPFEEDATVHLITADTAFQIARERRERLLEEFPRHRSTDRRRRRRLARSTLPGPAPDAA